MGFSILDLFGGKANLRRKLNKLDGVVLPELTKLIAKELPAEKAPAIAKWTWNKAKELIVGAL